MALGLAGRVRLKPLVSEHYERIFSWMPEENIGARWRFNNGLPTIDQFAGDIWFGVMEQAVVCLGDDPTPQGLVAAYGVNLRNGTCYLSAVSAPAALRSGLTVGGAALFIERLFTTWPFRKIYADVTEYNMDSYRSVISHVAVVEARLRDSVLWHGKLHDRLTLTFERERWMAEASPFLKAPATEA